MEETKMKRSKSRTLAFLLATVLAFGLLGAMPFSAFADEPEVAAVEVAEEAEDAVEVAPLAGEVCSIGTDLYLTLDEALAAAATGDTITLLANVTEDVSVVVPTFMGADELTIELSGFNLDLMNRNVVVDGGDLTITGGGSVLVKDAVSIGAGGTLVVNANIVAGGAGIDAIESTATVTGNVSGGIYGVSALDSTVSITGDVSGVSVGVGANNSTLTVVGNVSCTGPGLAGVGVFVFASDVTVTGNVDSQSGGVRADGPNTLVTINGNITTPLNGVYTTGEAEAVVNGSIVSDMDGVVALESSVVTVNGNIDSQGAGVIAQDDAELTVNGNIKAEMVGVFALGSSTVTVIGNIDAVSIILGPDDYAAAVYADDDANVYIEGNVKAFDGDGVAAYSSAFLVVIGNVTTDGGGKFAGAYAAYDAQIFITGLVTATHPTEGTGAWSSFGGQITIDGAISAVNYIRFYDTAEEALILLPTDNEPTSSKAGFLEYTEGVGFVWVSNAIPTPPVDKPAPELPAAGDFASFAGLIALLALAALGTTGLVISRKLRKKESL